MGPAMGVSAFADAEAATLAARKVYYGKGIYFVNQASGRQKPARLMEECDNYRRTQPAKPGPASAWRSFSLPAHSERGAPVTMFW